MYEMNDMVKHKEFGYGTVKVVNKGAMIVVFDKENSKLLNQTSLDKPYRCWVFSNPDRNLCRAWLNEFILNRQTSEAILNLWKHGLIYSDFESDYYIYKDMVDTAVKYAKWHMPFKYIIAKRMRKRAMR